MKIYFAGPLFTAAEREFNNQMATYLKNLEHQVFLPQDHEPRELTAKNIFQSDVNGLNWCTVVVAIMDGPDPDSGTSWEVGYAYAKGIPILCVRTDFRGSGEGNLAPYNIMLSESCDKKIYFSSVDKRFSWARIAIEIDNALKEIS